MSQCEHRDKLPPDVVYNSPCHICAIEKRVEELSQRMTGLEMKRIERVTIQPAPFIPPYYNAPTVSASPVEPKLHSSFTLEEWELMFRDGPLLLEAGRLELWFNAFRGGFFIGGIHKFQDDEVSLIEQPNWRPHRTDECPVPGRVKVKIEYNDGLGAWAMSSNASEFIWKRCGHAYSDIRAYRILGT